MTDPRGIDGANIVGSQGPGWPKGFLYDGVIWTVLDFPGARSTSPSGIDGTNIVGSYTSGMNSHGFLYDGETWLTLDLPGASQTTVAGISGDRIVGSYGPEWGYYYHGFIYTIPEPATLLLLGLGGLAVLRRPGIGT